jgi:hypothetical protein
MPSSRRFRPKSGIPARTFGEDMLWLEPAQSRLHRGNTTAALIFKSAAAGKTEAQIVEDVLAEFEGEKEQITRETVEFLDIFVHEGLLEVIEE